jgi:L-Ala-D/L-Glu epimerase / N-acetyl-D-glutamate racemase
MELSVRIERWPLAGAFTISRGSKTEALVVVAELRDGTCRGRGESVPYRRYGETADGIVAAFSTPCAPAPPVMHSIVLTGTLTPRP